MKGFNVYHVLNDYSLELTTDYIHEDDYDIYIATIFVDGMFFNIEYLVHELARETHHVIVEESAPLLTGYTLMQLDSLKTNR